MIDAAAQVALDAAKGGQLVLWVSHNADEGRKQFEQLATDAKPLEPSAMWRSRGNQALSFASGGRIVFRSRGVANRGVVADLVVCDPGDWADPMTRANLAASLQAGGSILTFGGEIPPNYT